MGNPRSTQTGETMCADQAIQPKWRYSNFGCTRTSGAVFGLLRTQQLSGTNKRPMNRIQLVRHTIRQMQSQGRDDNARQPRMGLQVAVHTLTEQFAWSMRRRIGFVHADTQTECEPRAIRKPHL